MTYRFSNFGSWGNSGGNSSWNSQGHSQNYSWTHGGNGSDGTGKGSDGTGKGSDGTGKGSDGSKGGGSDACGGTSYHNGGVEGSHFSQWYDHNLSNHFANGGTHGGWNHGYGEDDGTGKGSDGTGKGSDGTGKGSDGTGKGSDGTGKGSDGTGKGSDGTGKGSDGTGKGSDGTGKGSDGTGKGSDGTGKGSDGTGKGSDGTGKGSDGTGKGSDGTGKGSDGTGKGSDGTGKGSCGTKGTEEPEEPETPPEEPVEEKITYHFTMGDPAEIEISVTQDLQGQLFFSMNQSDFEGEPADIDGLFFDLADNSPLGSLNFFPNENAPGQTVTDIQEEEDSVNTLPNGAGVEGNYDVGLQFGLEPDSSAGTVQTTAFTLWSDDGPVTFDDIDLSGMRLIINSDNGNGEVLGVSDSDDPNFVAADAAPDSEITVEDVMGLMTVDVEEEETEEVVEELELIDV